MTVTECATSITVRNDPFYPRLRMRQQQHHHDSSASFSLLLFLVLVSNLGTQVQAFAPFLAGSRSSLRLSAGMYSMYYVYEDFRLPFMSPSLALLDFVVILYCTHSFIFFVYIIFNLVVSI
jgi:hypothetical protein